MEEKELQEALKKEEDLKAYFRGGCLFRRCGFHLSSENSS